MIIFILWRNFSPDTSCLVQARGQTEQFNEYEIDVNHQLNNDGRLRSDVLDKLREEMSLFQTIPVQFQKLVTFTLRHIKVVLVACHGPAPQHTKSLYICRFVL